MRTASGADARRLGALIWPGFGVNWLGAGGNPNDNLAALSFSRQRLQYGVSRLLLRDHRIHPENLAGLGEMPPCGGWIIVGGLRIRGGSGSPATVFGLIP